MIGAATALLRGCGTVVTFGVRRILKRWSRTLRACNVFTMSGVLKRGRRAQERSERPERSQRLRMVRVLTVLRVFRVVTMCRVAKVVAMPRALKMVTLVRAQCASPVDFLSPSTENEECS